MKARIWYRRPEGTWVKVNGAENGPMLVPGAFLNIDACGTRAMAAAPVPFPSRGGSAPASNSRTMASPRAVPLYTRLPWITPGAGQRWPPQAY